MDMNRKGWWLIALSLFSGLAVAGSMLIGRQPTVIPPLILPHHDLVKDTRLELVKKHSEQFQPVTIILLSPNHFDSGNADIITTDRIWQIQGGHEELQPDLKLITTVEEAGLVELEDVAFNNEHGITNLLVEIHQYYPNAEILPLMIREGTEPDKITRLADLLSEQCHNCGVIASVDMSHYQPAHVAEIHDEKTLRALRSLDESEILEAEVDSRLSLLFVLSWAKQHGLERFEEYAHTNSGLMIQDNDVETTTHVMGQFVKGAKAEQQDIVTFTLAGDAMFGRKIGARFQGNNFRELFEHFGNRVFWGTDFSWLNLEGPVSDQTVVQSSDPTNTEMLFSKQTIQALNYLKLTSVGLANNHARDAGAEGLIATQELLKKNDILPLGQSGAIDQSSITQVQQGEVTVSFISVLAIGELTELTNLIEQESESGHFVVVLPHWGVEYQEHHSAEQETLARQWITAGAGLIVGSHPHVVQDAQVIDGALVLYSLGNFVFDQDFSVATSSGLIVTGEVSDSTLQLVLSPVVSRDLKPEVLRGDAKQDVINHVCADISDYCSEDIIEVPFVY